MVKLSKFPALSTPDSSSGNFITYRNKYVFRRKFPSFQRCVKLHHARGAFAYARDTSYLETWKESRKVAEFCAEKLSTPPGKPWKPLETLETAMNIEDFCERKASEGDGSFAIAFALLQVAKAQKDIAYQVRQIGLGDAASPMGAMEHLALQIREAGQGITDALSELADR